MNFEHVTSSTASQEPLRDRDRGQIVHLKAVKREETRHIADWALCHVQPKALSDREATEIAASSSPPWLQLSAATLWGSEAQTLFSTIRFSNSCVRSAFDPVTGLLAYIRHVLKRKGKKLKICFFHQHIRCITSYWVQISLHMLKISSCVRLLWGCKKKYTGHV